MKCIDDLEWLHCKVRDTFEKYGIKCGEDIWQGRLYANKAYELLDEIFMLYQEVTEE